MTSNNRGIVLLEVLIALMVLGTTGVALVALAAGAVRAELRDRSDERRFAEADRVLAAVTLLTPEELSQRLGVHTIGEFAVTIRRRDPGLYTISIGERDAPGDAELVTAIYRPPRVVGP